MAVLVLGVLFDNFEKTDTLPLVLEAGDFEVGHPMNLEDEAGSNLSGAGAGLVSKLFNEELKANAFVDCEGAVAVLNPNPGILQIANLRNESRRSGVASEPFYNRRRHAEGYLV